MCLVHLQTQKSKRIFLRLLSFQYDKGMALKAQESQSASPCFYRYIPLPRMDCSPELVSQDVFLFLHLLLGCYSGKLFITKTLLH